MTQGSVWEKGGNPSFPLSPSNSFTHLTRPSKKTSFINYM